MSAESQLPRPADGSPAGRGAVPPPGKGPSVTDLQAEVERSRAELGATIDALTTQLSVGYQAKRASRATRVAADDVRTFLSGGGLPSDDDGRSRNAKLLLGSVALVAVVVAVTVGRRAASRFVPRRG